MAIPGDLNTRQTRSIIESSSVSGQPAVAVVNPDGSSIGSGSGGGTVIGYPITNTAATATGAVVSATCNYYGFSFRETTGTTTALIILTIGAASGGVVLDEISLAPNESSRETYNGPNYTPSAGGIYATITGTVAGIVRHS